MFRSRFLMLLLLAVNMAVFAELETIVELEGLVSATRDDTGAPVFSGLQMSKLNFQSVGNSDVKAELELSALLTGQLFAADITRAYVKARFPGFRITAGKTRVSWGEGFLFNAGDVIFGSMSPVTDLTSAELREETDWLLDLYIPLGQFSYLEGIFLPYPPGHPADQFLITPEELRGGGRVVTRLAGVKVEAGYLYRADTATHNPYVSFEGNLFFDMHLSAALSVPAFSPTEQVVKDSVGLSFGLMRIFSFEDQSTLTLRLESACFPFGVWKQPVATESTVNYGLVVYPELVYAPLDVLALSLRTIINPVAGSGLVSFGVDFNIYQGFALIGYAWSMFGDGADYYFGFDRLGDVGLALGMRYIF